MSGLGQGLFDEHLDQVHRICFMMTCTKGLYHVKAHCSSSQLSCWFYDDPYNYKVSVKDEVFAPGFIDSFPSLSCEGRQPKIERHGLRMIMDEFKRPWMSDEQIYLRSASVNRFNGMIGMNSSCDGSHYIEHEEFFRRLREIGAGEASGDSSLGSAGFDGRAI